MRVLLESFLTQWIADHDKNIDLLLVIGGGSGKDLGQWRALQPRRLIVCEPHKRLAKALDKKLDPSLDETVLSLACVGRSYAEKTSVFYRLRMQEESGLYPPSPALAEFWPNMGEPITEEVSVVPIDQLLADTEIDGAARNLLLIDAPGAEEALLNAMGREQLHAFEGIVVRTGDQALYQSGSDKPRITRLLTDLGFKVGQEQEDEFTPHVSLFFEKDPIVIELEKLRHRNSVLEQEKTEFAAQLAEQLQRFEEHRRHATGQVETLEAQLAERTKALEEQGQRLDGQKKQLEDQQQKLEEQKQQLEARVRDNEALNEEKQKLETRVRDTEAGRAKEQKEKEELRQKLQEVEARQLLFNEELAKAEGQIELIKDLLLRENARL